MFNRKSTMHGGEIPGWDGNEATLHSVLEKLLPQGSKSAVVRGRIEPDAPAPPMGATAHVAVEHDPAPPTPPDILIWLTKNWIKGFDIDYRMTGCDTADTWIIFRPKEGKERETLFNPVKHYLEFQPDHASALRVNRDGQQMVETYQRWHTRNQRDLSEFKRLQKKLGL